MNKKVACKECGWNGTSDEWLEATNPFDPEDEIIGCPECKEINTMKALCATDGCLNYATCGTQTTKGYKWLCGNHYRIVKDEEEQ